MRNYLSITLLVILLLSCSPASRFGAGVDITFDPRTIGMQIDDTIMQKGLIGRLALKNKRYLLSVQVEVLDGNAVEAAARGASEGTQLVINIVGMLIAFVALVYMLDSFFVDLITPLLQTLTGTTVIISFTKILGWIFTPFAWLMGVPTQDCLIMGQLLGEKVVLTELIAYLNLSQMIESGQISARTQLLASYALCGFANFASVGIQIGGIGGIAPNRKADLAQMGMSAMFAGVLVTCTTATIAGIFIG